MNARANKNNLSEDCMGEEWRGGGGRCKGTGKKRRVWSKGGRCQGVVRGGEGREGGE